MDYKIFDTHFHLALDTDLPALLQAAEEANVTELMLAGASPDEMAAMLEKISPYKQIYAAVGVHPHNAEVFDGTMANYRNWIRNNPQVKAVGEIGLDFYYDFADRKKQEAVFRDFMTLAKEEERPAILHVREAFDSCLAILKEDYTDQPFVVHCFSGSPEQATAVLDLGGMISFTGLITFKKADEIRASMKIVPMDRLMFETDSPYLAPVPKRGKSNQPAYLPYTIQYAADFLNIDFPELVRINRENARRFFNIT